MVDVPTLARGVELVRHERRPVGVAHEVNLRGFPAGSQSHLVTSSGSTAKGRFGLGPVGDRQLALGLGICLQVPLHHHGERRRVTGRRLPGVAVDGLWGRDDLGLPGDRRSICPSREAACRLAPICPGTGRGKPPAESRIGSAFGLTVVVTGSAMAKRAPYSSAVSSVSTVSSALESLPASESSLALESSAPRRRNRPHRRRRRSVIVIDSSRPATRSARRTGRTVARRPPP